MSEHKDQLATLSRALSHRDRRVRVDAARSILRLAGLKVDHQLEQGDLLQAIASESRDAQKLARRAFETLCARISEP